METDELILVRNLYSLVLSYYLRSVRGGWRRLDHTANFFLFKIDQVGCLSHPLLILSIWICFLHYFALMPLLWFIIFQGELSNSYMLRDILDDIAGRLLQTSMEENIFLSEPCSDNALYFLKLIHELLVNQMGMELLVCF